MFFFSNAIGSKFTVINKLDIVFLTSFNSDIKIIKAKTINYKLL